jgi:hypothetical protein
MNTRRNRRSSRRNSRRNSRGGMAPIQAGMTLKAYQPSEGVMRWATTAGAATPSAAEMRNVAHGGSRRRRHRHGRKCGHKRHTRR